MANISEEERKRRSEHMKSVRAKAAEKKEAQKVELAEAAAEGTEKPVRRKRRNLFNGTQQNLTVEGRDEEHYVYHIFNDDPGRLEQALASDWEFVLRTEVDVAQSRNGLDGNRSIDSRVEFHVKATGSQDAGRGVLMKKRREWFEEDQKEIQDGITSRERQMIRQGGANTSAIGNTYVPGPAGRNALTIQRN